MEMIKSDEDLAREIRDMKFYRVRHDRFVKRSVMEIPKASG